MSDRPAAMRSSTVFLAIAVLLASGAAASEGRDARHHRLAAHARHARNATAPAPTPAAKTRTAAACAPSYKPSASVTTIKGVGTLPKATARVTRSGRVLKLGSKVYKVAGPNIVRRRQCH